MAGEDIAGHSVESLRSLAEEAVTHAGSVLAEEKPCSRVAAVELERDVKLVVDGRSEELILKVLSDSGFRILTEERGYIAGRDKTTELWWIVDPLDGSLNYMRNIPISCVSVGGLSGPKAGSSGGHYSLRKPWYHFALSTAVPCL